MQNVKRGTHTFHSGNLGKIHSENRFSCASGPFKLRPNRQESLDKDIAQVSMKEILTKKLFLGNINFFRKTFHKMLLGETEILRIWANLDFGNVHSFSN